jgi:folate-binding protein YgfZ
MPTAMSSEARTQVLQARSGFGIALLPDVVVLEVSGPDAVSFLQNRLSNDVLALQPGEGQLNAVLDRQAKIQGVFTLLRTAEGFRILIDRAEQANATAHMLKFKILEQIQIKEATNVAVMTVQGPNSRTWLAQIFQPDATCVFPQKEYAWSSGHLQNQPCMVAQHSLSGDTGYYVLIQADSPLEALLQEAIKANGIELSREALDILRVEAGIPKYGMDYDFETLLPETGLEREAVSYTKGCYLGQETIARIKTYGMVQKALIGLLLDEDAPLPPQGSVCQLDGKEVGRICSVVDSPTLKRPITMAYLGKTERVPGKVLHLQIEQQPYRVEVVLLPFYHQDKSGQKSGQELLNEGLKLFSDGFDEEAIRILQEAIEADNNLVEAYEALGVILSRHDRYDEAIQMMNQVLALEPEHVLAHTNLSVFYMKLGDKEKAEEEKAKATMAAFSKKAKEAGLVFDIEAERRKKEQATLEKINLFIEALKYNPSDPLGNFGLGSAYLELKRYQEAVEPLERTIQAQPKHSVAYLSLGKAWEGLNEKQKAIKTYQRGIEVAAAKGDLMPLKEMQARLQGLT